MLERPFESYLVDRFSEWAKGSIKKGFRYQFRSPDTDNSKQLFDALTCLCNEVVTDDDVRLDYFECDGVRVIPVIHGEVHGGCTEFYISKLRDKVAGQDGQFAGTCLLILHNSFLDTIINSALDLAAPGQVWHPLVMKGHLERLLTRNSPVTKCLLQTQFEIVLNEGATIFGLKPLYKALQDGRLEFQELGLFNDPLLQNFGDSQAQIRKRLEENRQLREALEFEAEYFSGQLEERLQKFDLGDKFIKAHFGKDGDWRELDFEELQAERNKNRTQELKIETLPAGDFEKVITRPRSRSKAGSRDLSVILTQSESKPGSSITISFSGGELKADELDIKPKEPKIEITLSRRVGTSQVKLAIPPLGHPTFFSLELKRSKTSEKFKFRFLCLPDSMWLVKEVENCFRVDPLRRQLVIETEETQLRITPSGDRKVELKDGPVEVSVENIDIVDFAHLAQETDSPIFTVRSGNCALKLCVEGASIQTEPIQLPYVLNRNTVSGLFDDKANVVFNDAKNKMVIDRSEIPVVGVRQGLLKEEHALVVEGILAKTRTGAVHITDLEQSYPKLQNSYSELFDYYRKHSTLPSLVTWGPEYVKLVNKVVDHYLAALKSINPDDILSPSQKTLVSLGFVLDEDKQEERIAPFQPLVLTYFRDLAVRISQDSNPQDGISGVPKITADRLSPQGLIPYVFYPTTTEYAQVLSINDLPSWLKISPPKEADYPFVRRLVRDKIDEFLIAYSVLFEGRPEGGTLLINCVNQRYGEQMLFGIRDYFSEAEEQGRSIHINFFDNTLEPNAFDKLAETHDQGLREWLRLDRAGNNPKSDQILQLLRTKLTYSRFTHDAPTPYAHLCFFSNANPVKYEQYAISKALCGIIADGFVSGPAAERKQESYFSGFGLRDCPLECDLIQMSGLLNALLRPARRDNTQYIKDQGYGLIVNTEFRKSLRVSFKSALWTTLIDPKVNLDFFESDEEVVLIHYSDQYTSTAGYDAITVTPQRDLFAQLISSKEQITEINAFNGTWLLQMLTKHQNTRKERLGIIGAYKFLLSMLFSDEISWVPLSAAEMIRVSGNIGLELTESDFSRQLHGYSRGEISDDVLFVGFSHSQMFIFPLEVKAGATPDFQKASRQALEMSRYMLKDILQGASLGRQLNRALFVRQVLMQLEKYKLYKVLEPSRLTHILDRKEWWLQGNFEVSSIPAYPVAGVLAYVDSKACYHPTFKLYQNILKIELPSGLQEHAVGFNATKIEDLCKHYNVPTEYQLRCRGAISAQPKAEAPLKAVDTATLEVVLASTVEDDAQTDGSSEVQLNADNGDTATLQSHSDKDDGPTVQKLANPAANSKERVYLRALLGHNQLGGQPLWWEPTNTNRFLNPNSGIIGTMGTGKTQFTKSVITQLVQGQHLNVGGKPVGVLIFDYKSDYVDKPFLEATSGTRYSLHNLPFNPLSLHGDMPMLPVHTANHFADTMARAYRLGPKQKTRLKDLILEAYTNAGISRADSSTWNVTAPSLQNVWHLYQAQEKVEIDSLHAALSSLIDFQIFETDGSKMKSLYDLTQGVTVIELAGHSPDVQNLVVGLTLDLFYAQMQKSGKPSLEGDHRQLSKIILVDEADNFMSQDFASLRKLLKEGREYGVGVVLSTQDITHFQTSENNYAAYILTWVIHRVSQIKNSDIKAIFNLDDKASQATLMEDVRKLEKHFSLFVDGEKNITRMRDRAFFELMSGAPTQ